MMINDFQLNLFNFLKEMIYIYDYEKNEIIFLNKIALNILGKDTKLPIKLSNKKEKYKENFFGKDILNSTNSKENILYNGNKYKVLKSIISYKTKKYILCIIDINETDKKSKKILKRNDILIETIKILSTYSDIFEGVYKVLEILGHYYKANKIYMSEGITEDIETIYVHKWSKNDKMRAVNSIDNNYDLTKWNEIIADNEAFIENIADIKEKWQEKYIELKNRNVKNVVIIIMKFLDEPVGYIQIENINANKQEFSTLNSLVYFVLNEIKRKQMSEKLSFMSYYDGLTGINNKNKYIKCLNNIKSNKLMCIGVAFMDINGLTKIIEKNGYAYGDRAIVEVATSLKKNFRKDDLYRIEGDKFIILSQNIEKDVFYNKVNKINTHFLDLREYSVSIGYVWEENCQDIDTLIYKAEEYMYHAKKNHHKAMEKYNIEIFSSMATQSETNKDKLKVVIGHDTSLDFQNYKAYFQPKQEIFNFKVKQLIKNNNNKSFVMVMLDINNFKAINEMYGFSEGNKILFNIGNAINKAILPKGVSCHMHSDYYYFFYEAVFEEDVLDVIYDIEIAIKNLVANIKVILSYGIYKLEKEDMKNINTEEMCKKASYAHKISKQDGMKNITFYRKSLRDIVIYEKELEDDMEESLKNGEFKMYLQPKYDIKTETIEGAEALVRWEHKKKGLLYPSKFIALFEKNGFIIKIDMHILEQVCKFLKKNKEKGYRDIMVSVNMSKLHFKELNFVENVLSIIKKYDIDPSLIEIEITESLVAENQEYIIGIIEEFKACNLSISIDDFGSGYSSFSILKSLPVDILKIDYSFFKDFKRCTKGSIIIRSIVMLAKELHLKTVAEGVEKIEEVEYLKEIQCDMVQGYYYSKPIPLEKFEKIAFEKQKLDNFAKKI